MMNLSPFQWFYSVSDDIMIEFIDNSWDNITVMTMLMSIEIQLAEEFSKTPTKKLILN